MYSLDLVFVILLCIQQHMPNVYGLPIVEETAGKTYEKNKTYLKSSICVIICFVIIIWFLGISLPLPSIDSAPPIPFDGNDEDVVRLENFSNASTPSEIMVDATNAAETSDENGSDLNTDASQYYGYGYSRYRPLFYNNNNYYGNPYYYNHRYYGNYYQPPTPQYPQYYYPRSSYYYGSKFYVIIKHNRFESILIYRLLNIQQIATIHTVSIDSDGTLTTTTEKHSLFIYYYLLIIQFSICIPIFIQ